MYVPADGTATTKAPADDVVAVGSGDEGMPHGIDVADSVFRQVAAFGT
jgi:hypothetical protein